ncbi:MAG: glycosyltransferase [Planctomycetota bacterium]
MSAGDDALNLSSLDAAIPVQLEAQVLANNLAALGVEQPDLAEQLAETKLPPAWRPVRAHDGVNTYRLEAAAQAPLWLGGTAAPRTRAAGLLKSFDIGEQNPSLPSISAGAELQWLLNHISVYRAVYVFESELVRLAAVLRLVDISEACRATRCILVPPGREMPYLQEFLGRHVGLLPPGNIVVLPEVPSERIEQVRLICQPIAQHTYTGRQRRLEQLQTVTVASSPEGSATRLAVLAITQEPLSHTVSVALERDARRLGWEVRRQAVAGPCDIHPLSHCAALAEFNPNLTICVGHQYSLVPLPLGSDICEWYGSPRQIPKPFPEDNIWRLAASPYIWRELRNAAPSSARIAAWYWGCDVSAPLAERDDDSLVVLVADLPTDDPRAFGIDQPTHVQLWQHVRQQAARLWQRPAICQTEALLREAERAVGAGVGEIALRQHLLNMLERVLIPRVIVERIAQELARRAGNVCVFGKGWRQWPDNPIKLWQESVSAALVKGPPKPLAAVFISQPDVLRPELLAAGVAGWPLILHAPGRRNLRADLGDLLHNEQHYLTFADGRDLDQVLDTCQKDPDQARRRASRAREYLGEQHCHARRLEELVQLVRPPTKADKS